MVWDETNTEWDHLGGVSSGIPSSASIQSTVSVSFTEKIFTSGAEMGDIITPVELIYFIGTANDDNHVDLSWATATELNNDFFEVQRSFDGEQFEVIGIIDGNGTTNQEIEYGFQDRTARSGVNYYRLRQVDFDGAFEFHPIIQVENNLFEVAIEAMIYPNPATNENLNVRITSGDGFSPISIRLVDIAGKAYYQDQISGAFSIDQKILPTLRMVPGLYFMIVSQGTRVVKEKVIIR